jgi:hypothetical protein
MRGLDPRIHPVGKKSLSKDAMGFELRHRFDVELRIIEQRQMDLMAHRRNVGLIEYQACRQRWHSSPRARGSANI